MQSWGRRPLSYTQPVRQLLYTEKDSIAHKLITYKTQTNLEASCLGPQVRGPIRVPGTRSSPKPVLNANDNGRGIVPPRASSPAIIRKVFLGFAVPSIRALSIVHEGRIKARIPE